MPSTWSQILLHVVFSTKRREPLIAPEIQDRLFGYMGGIVRSLGGSLYAIGGMPDHVHLLIRWKTDDPVASLMRQLKGRSSVWVHETFPDHQGFKWQEGYGVFSVSPSNAKQVEQYILNQETHHKTRDFRAEFIELLRAHGVEHDERYMWD